MTIILEDILTASLGLLDEYTAFNYSNLFSYWYDYNGRIILNLTQNYILS